MAVVLAACTGAGNESHEGHTHGDLQEETSSADVLPSFLDGKAEEIRLVYRLAGASTDLLQWIPCYCGCGESVGHRSNMNCFIKEAREDGTVVWDDHGTRCGVCLEIAAQSVKLKSEGKSDLEIRDFIDQTYGKGYAAPTPTPMPM
ncbi:PCYCGC motif-containing (lipo)protein [Paenibacillus thermotolerans]|uniref:PCYCGC motif-containing (lipo)protein n=1 Tax=Paenibacillus thermotolerans TaxID=3027807 RepID=UPI003CC6D20E